MMIWYMIGMILDETFNPSTNRSNTAELTYTFCLQVQYTVGTLPYLCMIEIPKIR